MQPVSTCLEVLNYVTELTWRSTPTRILQLVGLKVDRPPTKQADQQRRQALRLHVAPLPAKKRQIPRVELPPLVRGSK